MYKDDLGGPGLYDPRFCLNYRLTFSLVIEHYVIVNLSYSEVGDISIQISIDATSVLSFQFIVRFEFLVS